MSAPTPWTDVEVTRLADGVLLDPGDDGDEMLKALDEYGRDAHAEGYAFSAAPDAIDWESFDAFVVRAIPPEGGC